MKWIIGDGINGDDDLERVEGNWDELVGLLQERYGKSREEAELELQAREPQ